MKTTPLARRLMALLAFLPEGLAEDDVRSLLGNRGVINKTRANETIVCLHQLRLVERRLDSRLRMLTPLRECAKLDISLMGDDKRRLIEHYLRIAEAAGRVGLDDWEENSSKVEAEIDNLDSICRLAVATNVSHKRLGEALSGLATLFRFTGRGETKSIEDAVTRARGQSPTQFAAVCIRTLADVANAQGKHNVAKANYKEALPLFKYLNNLVGQANCLYGLADIATGRSDVELARRYSEEALVNYRNANEVLGEANCVYHLGRIEIQCLELETASVRCEHALAVYRKIGNRVGEANCITSLGNIALARSDLELASTYYESAFAIGRRAGVVLNQANSLLGLGHVARISSDRDVARSRYEEALAVYRIMGIMASEAEATIRLGQSQQSDSLSTKGVATIETGFRLFFKCADPEDRALPGWRAIYQALTCASVVEADKYFEQARLAWSNLGRLDLVSEWINEK